MNSYRALTNVLQTASSIAVAALFALEPKSHSDSVFIFACLLRSSRAERYGTVDSNLYIYNFFAQQQLFILLI